MRISILPALLLCATTVMAENSVSENTGKGFYLGGGVGASRYSVTLTDSSYDYSDPDNPSLTFESSALEDRDTGSLWYAGYQINKIIAIEAGYINFGNFSKTIFGKDYSQSPKSFSVYANIGYTFLNGQLRPFGIAGLGYLRTNQSRAYERLNFKEDFVTVRLGFGGDYYPTALKGIGFRLAFMDDIHVESEYSDTGSTSETKSLWLGYSLLYAGVQYKF